MRILSLFILSAMPPLNQIIPDAAVDNEWAQKFHVDVYVRMNQWGESQESTHQVIALHFPMKKEQAREEATKFLVEEKHTQQTQVLYLHKDHIFYPGLFSEEGHREFNLPVCGTQTVCQVELFLFHTGWPSSLGPRLKMSVQGYDLKTGKKIFSHNYPEIKNKFYKEVSLDSIPRIQVYYQDTTSLGQVVLSESDIMTLRNLGVGYVDVLFQWRMSADQIEYSEHQESYKLMDGEQKYEFLLPRGLFYFGALLFYEINGVTFESKMEIINKGNDFYGGTKK